MTDHVVAAFDDLINLQREVPPVNFGRWWTILLQERAGRRISKRLEVGATD